MSITVRQYQQLSGSGGSIGATLLTAEAWDAMRTDSADTVFSIPATRELWVAKAMRNREVQPRAAAIVRMARELGVSGITSCGVGGAWLEYHIKRLAPELRLTIGDFAPMGVERLRRFFVECDEIRQFDMLQSPWHDDGSLLLLHRVDTDFDNRQWHGIFRRTAAAGISRVLFLPSMILSRREAILHVLRSMRIRLLGIGLVFCGWLRTLGAIRALWRDSYVLERQEVIGGLTCFSLRLVQPQVAGQR